MKRKKHYTDTLIYTAVGVFHYLCADMAFPEEVLRIFHELAAVPRPSHHESRVADFLCDFARRHGLEYERDANDCVVIRKPASPGHENAPVTVLLNHMDMVAVSDGTCRFDPLTDGIEPYVEDGWMKARGTSLGADNGIGLSMALAVLADDDLVHGPLEVLTTTNEEDGMTGAAGLSPGFIKGRRVINLDSEDFDTITVGAAGAFLQTAEFVSAGIPVSEGLRCFRIGISGGSGGHSGVDIGKNRINAIHELAALLYDSCPDLLVFSIDGGDANASIASACTAVVGVPETCCSGFSGKVHGNFERLRGRFTDGKNVRLDLCETVPDMRTAFCDASILKMIAALPYGVIRMHDTMPGTVMTSNNIGVVRTEGSVMSISCHTRSFSDTEMAETAGRISSVFKEHGARVEVIMNTPAWQENGESEFIRMTESTFRDVLGFAPRKVAMHFVLEAGYYVNKYPGIEIACIGPRIIEPHSPGERVEMSTVYGICRVLTELLARLA